MCILQTRAYAKGGLMELKFEGIEMRKLNIPTDTGQRVDENNGAICLVIMFTHEVMVMNCPYFVFSADDSKASVIVWGNI